jgi:hypothetical protein
MAGLSASWQEMNVWTGLESNKQVKQHRGRNRRQNIEIISIDHLPLHLLERLFEALLETTLASIFPFALARKWTRVGSSLTSLGLAEQ